MDGSPAADVILRVAVDPRRVDAWSLVLEALSIPHRIVTTDVGNAIVVDGAVSARAAAALEAHDREAAEPVPVEPDAPDQGASALAMVLAIGLTTFFFVTGPRSDARWFTAGSAVAERILRGEWWRAVTALTLHADAAHVLGNAVALIIFVSALTRWLGRGVAAFLVLASGFAGNLLTAALYGSHHDSIGASTAAFGALGLLGGLQMVRRFRFTARVDRRRRALVVIAACLGLFAMIGVGERTDVIAHLAGLASGLALGLVTAAALRRSLPPLAQWGLVAASVGAIVACWLRALSLI